MQAYVNHVDQVNEMEMFYGDETLRELIRHGKSLVETFEEYKVDYFPILEWRKNSNYDNESERSLPKKTAPKNKLKPTRRRIRRTKNPRMYFTQSS